MMILLTRIFAMIGLMCVTLFSYGMFLDIQAMDETEGGYEAPFVGVTGKTLDWEGMDITNTGVVQRGHVVNFIVNATTGMISLEILGIEFEARPLSQRAIVVHKPREAFINMGFNPRF
ncbi:hypothetical protein [Vibrio sonorensis]|uniref:hypothetical protein n=1 Tax=Vibrio sonorensis TaxID=1004316 RepID=UPI001586E4EF|nr:hypothetical protein [Vibrio sonorensis]